jgi:hypothetical protein
MVRTVGFSGGGREFRKRVKKDEKLRGSRGRSRDEVQTEKKANSQAYLKRVS